jgi:hypothetical protein
MGGVDDHSRPFCLHAFARVIHDPHSVLQTSVLTPIARLHGYRGAPLAWLEDVIGNDWHNPALPTLVNVRFGSYSVTSGSPPPREARAPARWRGAR